MSQFDVIIKVLLLGESSVGKSSVILRYMNNKFESKILSTVGIDFKHKIVDMLNKKVKIILFDTSGQERYHNLTANYYKNCDSILCVYDVTKRNTFLKIDYWLDQIKQHSSIEISSLALLGNKTDIVNREVSTEEGKKMADKYKMTYYEGSALTGNNIAETIEGVIIPLVRNSELEETNNASIHLNDEIKKAKPIRQEKGCC